MLKVRVLRYRDLVVRNQEYFFKVCKVPWMFEKEDSCIQKNVLVDATILMMFSNHLSDFIGVLMPLFGPSMLERLCFERLAGRYLPKEKSTSTDHTPSVDIHSMDKLLTLTTLKLRIWNAG